MPIRDQEEKYHQLEQGRRPVGFDDRPVVIGDDCWLGTNVVVMPGVVLGAGCVVGANSVVTKSFPSGVVIAGAPARQISLRCN
ncbi:DapH/DapD/GlmU-related protein [Eoetvoesiella caeni]